MTTGIPGISKMSRRLKVFKPTEGKRRMSLHWSLVVEGPNADNEPYWFVEALTVETDNLSKEQLSIRATYETCCSGDKEKHAVTQGDIVCIGNSSCYVIASNND